MNSNNEWLNKEIKSIDIENRRDRNKNYDNKTMIKYLVALIPLLIIGISLNAIECANCLENVSLELRTVSAQWRCKVCRDYVYSEESDWKGDFYCPKCGTRKGDE